MHADGNQPWPQFQNGIRERSNKYHLIFKNVVKVFSGITGPKSFDFIIKVQEIC